MTEANLTKFRNFATAAIRYDDVSDATKLVEILKGETELTPELQDWKVKLQFIRFPALTDQVAMDLLRTRLLTVRQIPDYDLVDKIGKKISFLILPESQVQFMQNALDALDKNTEQLGGKAIKDWVNNYYNFRSATALRSSLDEINFVNQSPDTAILNQEDKNFLLTLLKITDSLRNSLQEIQTPSVNPADDEFPADFDYSTLIPGIVQQKDLDSLPSLESILGNVDASSDVDTLPSIDIPPVPVQQRRTTPPELQTPSFNQSLTRVPQRAAKPVANTPAPKPAPQTKPQVPPSLGGVRRPPTANVNMQDILNRQGQRSGGVVFDNQTNVKVEEMTQRIEAERQQQQTAIDKKLAELKKRKS